MPLLNIFKKKKPVQEKKKDEKPEKAAEVKLQPAKEKILGQTFPVLKSPHTTEKATDLTGKNQYVFEVWPRANKPEIKKAVENLYGVNVSALKIINIPRKKRRLGKISGWRKGYKKAIVKIKEGQKIEILPR